MLGYLVSVDAGTFFSNQSLCLLPPARLSLCYIGLRKREMQPGILTFSIVSIFLNLFTLFDLFTLLFATMSGRIA